MNCFSMFYMHFVAQSSSEVYICCQGLRVKVKDQPLKGSVELRPFKQATA